MQKRFPFSYVNVRFSLLFFDSSNIQPSTSTRMPIETETSAQGRRNEIARGPVFDIETNNGLTASNQLFIVMASAGIGLVAWFVGELVSDRQRVLDDLVVRLRNSETQLAMLRAEICRFLLGGNPLPE